MRTDITSQRRAGRKSAILQARELFTLWGALSGDGSILDVDTVSRRLCISREYAQQLLELIVTARGEEDTFIPLYYIKEDDPSQVALAPSSQASGQPLRLTPAEHVALSSALNTLGLPNDDPLRQKIKDLAGDGVPSDCDIQRCITSANASDAFPALMKCAEGMSDGKALRFEYQGSNDSHKHIRKVFPLSLQLVEGTWLLSAYDYARLARRSFRIDRMSSIHLIPGKRPAELETPYGTTTQRSVNIQFEDPRYLTLFEWPGLKITSHRNGVTSGVIPFYGASSKWLARHIAACGGTVTTDDQELNELIDGYVLQCQTMERQLSEL